VIFLVFCHPVSPAFTQQIYAPCLKKTSLIFFCVFWLHRDTD